MEKKKGFEGYLVRDPATAGKDALRLNPKSDGPIEFYIELDSGKIEKVTMTYNEGNGMYTVKVGRNNEFITDFNDAKNQLFDIADDEEWARQFNKLVYGQIKDMVELLSGFGPQVEDESGTEKVIEPPK